MPTCPRCESSMLPFSTEGVRYRCWSCCNPECGFHIDVKEGSFGSKVFPRYYEARMNADSVELTKREHYD